MPVGLQWVQATRIYKQSAQEGGKAAAIRTGRLYPEEKLLLLISVIGRVDTRAIVQPEGLSPQKKIPMTPSEIEPATFRLVAQCLNRSRNRVQLSTNLSEIIRQR